MPIQKAPPEFHAPGQGASVTPHLKSQLAMIDECRGWRRLDSVQSTTIVYVVCHPQQKYKRTIYAPFGHFTLTQSQYVESFSGKLSEVEVPEKWAERMADVYGDSAEMEQVVARINDAETAEGMRR